MSPKEPDLKDEGYSVSQSVSVPETGHQVEQVENLLSVCISPIVFASIDRNTFVSLPCVLSAPYHKRKDKNCSPKELFYFRASKKYVLQSMSIRNKEY